MRRLITKLQYKDHEPGEFSGEQERTLEEVMEVIRDFPWEEQRQHIEIRLTDPSVTIQNDKREFLKLSPFFRGKYTLYFLNERQQLYTLSFVRLEDHFPYIEQFYASERFDPSGFKLENTWMQHPEKHFYSLDFNYKVTPRRAFRFFLSTSGLNMSVVLFFIIMEAIFWNKLAGPFPVLLFACFFFFFGASNCLLVLNYYFRSRNKILIMSRGNDVFYFGNITAPVKYSKKDIDVVYHHRVNKGQGKSSLTFFEVFEIRFNDGTEIKFSNIFCSGSDIQNRLFSCKMEDKNSFPFL